MRWYEDKDTVRMWSRIFIALYFFGMFAYVVVVYTGLEEESIKPMTIWAFIAGIIMSKVIDWFFQDGDSDGHTNKKTNRDIKKEPV